MSRAATSHRRSAQALAGTACAMAATPVAVAATATATAAARATATSRAPRAVAVPWSGAAPKVRPSPLVRPGPIWGPYPERQAEGPEAWQRWGPRLEAWQRAWTLRRDRPRFERLLHAALADPGARPAPIAALRGQGFTPEACAQALAHLTRHVEAHCGYAPHFTQHLAAWTMLQGCLVEMATGEGKTLATFLAAACAGLAGVPVHVLTANDYLAERDAHEMAPLYAALGLRVDHVVEGRSPAERRRAYAADVTYASAKELAFDHLRDRLGAGRPDSPLAWQAQRHGGTGSADGTPLLRGLCLALLDEADSILCDEARVPLILAQAGDEGAGLPAPGVLAQILSLAREMRLPEHARLSPDSGQLQLRSAGRAWLAGRVAGVGVGASLPAAFHDARWREDWLLRALTALHGLTLGRDYAIAEGAIVFIDALSGRAAPERQWSRGLHQLLALKEGLAPPPAQQTLAQMSYQRLFRRYHRLGGMSGTLGEVRGEMAATYGTPVVAVPRHHPSRLQSLGTFLVADERRKWATVVQRVEAMHRSERPVLVGTGSVAESELLAGLLRARGLRPLVLNAVQNTQEHAVIARAGQPGRITVSTQMAGRGTDIRLDERVRALGGLHVLACGQTHNARQWRQLIGRAGRQGDPGSFETVLETGSGVLAALWPRALQGCLCQARPQGRLAPLGLRLALRWQEWCDTRERRRVTHHDRAWARQLAFSGTEE